MTIWLWCHVFLLLPCVTCMYVCLVAGSWGLTIGHSSSLPPGKRGINRVNHHSSGYFPRLQACSRNNGSSVVLFGWVISCISSDLINCCSLSCSASTSKHLNFFWQSRYIFDRFADISVQNQCSKIVGWHWKVTNYLNAMTITGRNFKMTYKSCKLTSLFVWTSSRFLI